jgi:agmatine/peptidylarginine deiminase
VTIAERTFWRRLLAGLLILAIASLAPTSGSGADKSGPRLAAPDLLPLELWRTRPLPAPGDASPRLTRLPPGKALPTGKALSSGKLGRTEIVRPSGDSDGAISSSKSSGASQAPGWDAGPLDRLERLPNLPAPPVPAIPLIEKTYRLPGEFEPQRALLLSGRELLSEMPDVFADIVQATQHSIDIVTLVNDADEADLAREILKGRSIEGRIRLATVAHNTMWTRDYGPLAVEWSGQPAIVDPNYGQLDRPDDDLVPLVLAGRLQLPVIKSPLLLEGGNLLSNGRGLCISTRKVLDDNLATMDELLIEQWLARTVGAARIVFLEPLVGEATGHVDMFATFVAAHTVVVGAYDPLIDPENAGVLDRNAQRLAQLSVEGRPLRVVRIPMPARDDAVWRTYTNVVYANGVLLVPIYPGRDEFGQRRALESFARLLPGWRVVGVDVNRLIECGGALHCVTMNLGPLGKLPHFPKPKPGTGAPRRPANNPPANVARAPRGGSGAPVERSAYASPEPPGNPEPPGYEAIKASFR